MRFAFDSFFVLEICLDLFDHFCVFRIVQINLTGVHLEGGAVFVTALVFGNQMHMQVAAGITVSTVIDLIGMECLV